VSAQQFGSSCPNPVALRLNKARSSVVLEAQSSLLLNRSHEHLVHVIHRDSLSRFAPAYAVSAKGLGGSGTSEMTSVRPCTLPPGALLHTYAQSGAYTDCYAVEVPRAVTHGEFVEAFYTTSIFKVERWLLAKFLSRPSTDAEAHRLATGGLSKFAAWSVEQRESNQILLAAGHTRSWLMASLEQSNTKLYFGSAVVPSRSGGSGASRMGWQFRALLGFHKVYSQVLLAAASRKLAAIA